MDDLRNDIIALIQQIRRDEWKKSASIDLKHKSVIRARIEDHVAFCDYLIDCISKLDSARSDLRFKCEGCGYLHMDSTCDICARNYEDRYRGGVEHE